jgi:subtilisin family serine protease
MRRASLPGLTRFSRARNAAALPAFAFLLLLLPVGLRAAPPASPLKTSPTASTPATAEEVARERQQHLERFGVPAWHTAGYRGRGVRVAILDSGFRGYRDSLGKALPVDIIVRSFRLDGNLEARDSQHGILCAEVVHALAPEAELLLANWEPGRPEQFLRAVRWAREQGARVISCSCIMPDWSDGDGGGAVHAELTRLLGTDRAGPREVLFFACAGNTAERHWCGDFRAAADGWHQWRPGREVNLLEPWGEEEVSVQLYCPAGATYEVRVYDRQTGMAVARAVTSGAPDRCVAEAAFDPQPDRTYAACVRLLSGTPGRFHLVALHSSLEYARQGSSICFPADGQEVIAVGAVTAEGKRCAYSACGPNSPRPKPDLVAPVPIPTTCRTKPFGGTSAAAPQAAALAALCWSRHGDWSAAQVRAALRAAALDLGPPGHDCETGYGLVRLP